MAVIERVEAQLVADAGQFVQGMGRAQASVRQLDPHVGRLGNSLTQLGLRAAGFSKSGASLSRILSNIVLDATSLGVEFAAVTVAIGAVAMAFRKSSEDAKKFELALDGVHKRANDVAEALQKIKGPALTEGETALAQVRLAQGALDARLQAVHIAEADLAALEAQHNITGGSASPQQAVARALKGQSLTESGQALDFERRLEQARSVLSQNNRLLLEADAAMTRARASLAAYNVEQDKKKKKDEEAAAQRAQEIADIDAWIQRKQIQLSFMRLERNLAAGRERLTAGGAGGIGIRTDALNEAMRPAPEMDVKAQLDKIIYDPARESAEELEQLGRNAGQALVTGLMMGIDSMEDVWKLMLSVFASSLMGVLTKKLGIASPSRLTMKMGEQLGQGLIVGMQATQAAVNAAALDLAPVGALGSVGAQSTRALGDLSLRASLDVSGVMGAPMNPFAAARDADWQRLFRESALVAKSQGARLA